MSVCHAASIGILEDAIEYTGPNGAHWRIPISQVLVLGEYQSAEDDRGVLLALLYDDSGAWLQAPRNATGADQLLATLFGIWRAGPPPDLDPIVIGRVLWPVELTNEPLFDFETRGRQVSAAVSNWMARQS